MGLSSSFRGKCLWIAFRIRLGLALGIVYVLLLMPVGWFAFRAAPGAVGFGSGGLRGAFVVDGSGAVRCGLSRRLLSQCWKMTYLCVLTLPLSSLAAGSATT